MCLGMFARGNSSLGNKRHHQTLRLGHLPSSRRREKQPHDPLSLLNGLLLPSTCTCLGSRCGGLHIKQSGAFDVDGNTNTDLS